MFVFILEIDSLFKDCDCKNKCFVVFFVLLKGSLFGYFVKVCGNLNKNVIDYKLEVDFY